MKGICKFLIVVFIFSTGFSRNNTLTKTSIKHGMSIRFGNENISISGEVSLNYFSDDTENR